MKDRLKAFGWVVVIFSLLLFSGCKTKTVYIPVETVKKEYVDKFLRDSIYLSDSVFVDRFIKGDTVFLTKEKYKYLYKDKLRVDTAYSVDTIRVPYPVKGNPIPYVTGWQNFQIWLGRLFILALLFIIGKRFLVKKFL